MERFFSMWAKLAIRKKFNLAFSLLLFLTFLVVLTACFSFLSVKNAEDAIRRSTEIRLQVLEMNRGMERSHRLLSDFFLNHRSLGLQKAHEQFAQPSVRQTAKVISISTFLKEKLFHSELKTLSRIDQVDVNLYLASARRFATTSIEAVELLSRRVAPERGIEAQLLTTANDLGEELKDLPHLDDLKKEIYSYIRKYQIKRQRHLMQSAFNSLDTLRNSTNQEMSLQDEQKKRIFTLINSTRGHGEELLDVDRRISAKLKDFMLHKQIVSPTSDALIKAAVDEVTLVQNRIDKVYRLASIIIFSIAIVTFGAIYLIAKLLNSSITGKIHELTESAHEFGTGNMSIRASESSQDELGELAQIFNTMASQVQQLVDNLEQKIAQRTAELTESEERFRHLVNDLPKVAVQGYDIERRVTYWNHASELLYGFSEKEALGNKIEDLIIPEPMKEIVIKAVQDWLDNDVVIPSSELTLCNKYGNEVSVYSSHVMLVSSQGEKTMYCVDLDLADLKLAQAMERKSESFYRQLFDHSSSGVAVYEAVDNGKDFIFKDFNRAGEEIDGVSKESLLGRKVTEAYPGVSEMGLLKIFQQVWESGKPCFHPVSFYEDQKLQGWRENRVYKLPSGEIVAVYEDLTKEKQLEEEKHAIEIQLNRVQKMETIGLMAGGVAHDLNNILSGIIGYPELMLHKLPEDSELRKPIEAIHESGKRAATVVADLLTVARGAASIREPHDVNSLIKEYLSSPECKKLKSLYTKVSFIDQLSDTQLTVSCSPVHIKKCVMNLLTNAAEAVSQAGVVTISTACHNLDRDTSSRLNITLGNYVVISVSDTGSGIPSRDLDHIFEPFYSKKMMGRSGTGLGLTVVWNTMEDHKGKVLVESNEKGTCFQLYFPVCNEEEIVPASSEDVFMVSDGSKQILVVDDEKHLQDIASQMLGNLGYIVHTVSSGEMALDFLIDHKVDLIVLDMLMPPGIDGLETYQRIINLYPSQKAIVASGFSESENVKATLELGAGGFIKKPYSMNQLGRVVGEVLKI